MLSNKRLLSQSERQSLEFEVLNGQVYVITMDKVIEERCDELDNDIEAAGYEILHRDYQRVATSIYNYKVYFH